VAYGFVHAVKRRALQESPERFQKASAGRTLRIGGREKRRQAHRDLRSEPNPFTTKGTKAREGVKFLPTFSVPFVVNEVDLDIPNRSVGRFFCSAATAPL
jgi:hypothetical protein